MDFRAVFGKTALESTVFELQKWFLHIFGLGYVKSKIRGSAKISHVIKISLKMKRKNL